MVDQKPEQSKVSVHVTPRVRDLIMAYKYENGLSDADEAVRDICQEAGVL